MDQFKDDARYATVIAAFCIGLIALVFGFWPLTPLFWIIGIICFFLRYRITLDFDRRLFVDERGLVTPRAPQETSFDDIANLEVGFQDVQTRGGPYRSYQATLNFTDRSRNPSVFLSDASLEKVASQANEIGKRSGIAIQVSRDLERLRQEFSLLPGQEAYRQDAGGT